MSHFTVLVIGNDVEEQLQPYHEYECTGIEDEYVEFVDHTDEVTQEFADLDNNEEYKTLSEYANDYYGYDVREDGRIGHLTNPNAKWDWWVVGGRWSGFFKTKPGVNSIVGEPGVFGNAAEPGHSDCIRKGNVDLEGMRFAAQREASAEYDKFEEITADLAIPPTWEQVREIHDSIDEARRVWGEYLWVQTIRSADIGPWSADYHEYFCVHTGGREKFIENAVNSVAVPFAVVKNGEWFEKGSMGWFGMAADEKDQDDWNKQVSELLDEAADDTMLTLVDCHI